MVSTAGGAGSDAGGPEPDAITVLLGEHETILQVLQVAERECRRIERTGLLREAFWWDVLHFGAEFDARLHHHKEEDLLFPALERAGLPSDSGPTAVLRSEHLRIEHSRTRLDEALAHRDQNRLVAAADQYIEVARGHVLKENQIAFPLARRLLTADELVRLREDFRPLAADQRLATWLRDAPSAGSGPSPAAIRRA
jgi:hemerythrin-like domain-containing protein